MGSHRQSIEWWHCRWPSVIPNPQITPNSTFCVAFHIFVLGEHRNFKFGEQVDHSKSHSTDDKLSLKGVLSRDMTHFKFLVPLKYIWNGLSYQLQIWYIGWPREVLAFGLTSSGRGHGHVTSLNFWQIIDSVLEMVQDRPRGVLTTGHW